MPQSSPDYELTTDDRVLLGFKNVVNPPTQGKKTVELEINTAERNNYYEPIRAVLEIE